MRVSSVLLIAALLAVSSVTVSADWVPGGLGVSGGGRNTHFFAISDEEGALAISLDAALSASGEAQWTAQSEPMFETKANRLLYSATLKSNYNKMALRGEVVKQQGDGFYTSVCAVSNVTVDKLSLNFSLPLDNYPGRPLSADDKVDGPFLFDKVVTLRASKIVLAEGCPGQIVIETAGKLEWKIIKAELGGKQVLKASCNIVGETPVQAGYPIFFTARISARDMAPAPYISLIHESEGPVYRYGLYEAAFQFIGVKIANPVDMSGIPMRAVVSGPDGKEVTVTPFYYQPFVEMGVVESRKMVPAARPCFVLRYCPRNKGKYTGGIWLSPDSEPARFAFDAEDADGGFVMRSPEDSRYFIRSNGKSFVPVGHNLGWLTSSLPTDFDSALSNMASNGVNATRIWNCSWGINITDVKAPFGINQQGMAILDHVLETASAKGIAVIFVMTNAHDHKDNPSLLPYYQPKGKAQKPEDFFTNEDVRNQFRQHAEYLAHRLSAHSSLFAFELGNELTYLIAPDELATWYADIAKTIRTADINRHMITGSLGFNEIDSEFWLASTVDFTQYHGYSRDIAFLQLDIEKDEYAMCAGASEELSKLGMPSLVTEFGYYVDNDKASLNSVDKEGINLHNGLWASLFTGHSGTAMNWWWEGHIFDNSLLKHYRAISKFLAGIDFPKEHFVQESPELGAAKVSILRGESTILAWFRDPAASWYSRIAKAIEPKGAKGLMFNLKGLKRGTWRVVWWDTVRGVELNNFTAIVEGNSLTLKVPDFTSDIALKVTAERLR